MNIKRQGRRGGGRRVRHRLAVHAGDGAATVRELSGVTVRMIQDIVLILLIVPGSQLLIYPVLWILMPNEAPAAQFLPVTEQKETASAA